MKYNIEEITNYYVNLLIPFVEQHKWVDFLWLRDDLNEYFADIQLDYSFIGNFVPILADESIFFDCSDKQAFLESRIEFVLKDIFETSSFISVHRSIQNYCNLTLDGKKIK